MDSATLLLITQILSLAAQAAAQIPALKNAFTQDASASVAEQQAQIDAHLKDAQANLQAVIKHASDAMAVHGLTPAA